MKKNIFEKKSEFKCDRILKVKLNCKVKLSCTGFERKCSKNIFLCFFYKIFFI